MANDYKPLNNAATNLEELLMVQNSDGIYASKYNGKEPFEVLAAKTIFNNYADVQAAIAADVEGPASATDNALARFDGTTGKLIQNSNAILTDAGALSLASNLTVSGITTGTQSANNGTLRFNSVNTSAGTSAVAGYLITGDTNVTALQQYSTGYSGAGINLQNTAVLYTNSAGLNLCADNASGAIGFYTGGQNLRLSISSTGNTTLAGNLTVSGTGTSTFSGRAFFDSNISGDNVLRLKNANSSGYGLSVQGGNGSSQYTLYAMDYAGNALMTLLGNGNLTVSGDTFQQGTSAVLYSELSGSSRRLSSIAGDLRLLGARNTGSVTNGVVVEYYDSVLAGNREALRINNAAGLTTLQFASNGETSTFGGNLTVSGGTITGGSSGLSLAAGGTNQNVNITPSGSGIITSSQSNSNARIDIIKNTAPALNHIAQIVFGQGVGGGFAANDRSWQVGSLGASSTAADFFLQYWNGSSYAQYLTLKASGNLLLGTTTDGGQKLQVSGTAIVSSTTDSSSTSTGALVVSGGLGVAKKIYAGNLIQTAGPITSAADGSAGNFGQVQASTSVAAAIAQIYATNSSSLEVSMESLGTGMTRYGESGEGTVLFLNNPSGGNRPKIIFGSTGTSPALRIGAGNTGSWTEVAKFDGATLSTGGLSVSYSTDSSSTSTGSIITSGGVGIAKKLYVGDNATFAGSIAIGNTVQTAVSVASTHKVTISIGGSTYYLLATNV